MRILLIGAAGSWGGTSFGNDLAIRHAAGDALIKPEVYRPEDEWMAKNGA